MAHSACYVIKTTRVYSTHGGGHDAFLYTGAAGSSYSVVSFSICLSWVLKWHERDDHLTILSLPVASRLNLVLFGYEGIAYYGVGGTIKRERKQKVGRHFATSSVLHIPFSISYAFTISHSHFCSTI